MRILFISLLLLTLVGCFHSNSARHYPALYYYDSQGPTEQIRQQDLADLNHQQQHYPYVSPYTYTIVGW
jgi:hypothetical protein